MESSARATKQASGKSRWLWWFVGGLALGVVGTIFVPDLARPYTPVFMRGEDVEISGVVEAKVREPDRLLLTIAGSSGAVLVTYTRQIPEMDLLIEPGDSVILAVREYEPFVEDPSVRRVQKGSSIQGRPIEAAEEQDAGQSEIQRRKVPANEVVGLEPTAPDHKEDFNREIGPEDSTAAAVEGEADAPDAPDDQTPDMPVSEQQEEPQK